MNTRTLLSAAALLVATALPAIGSAQRHYRSQTRTSYGRGPFYPSYIPGPSYNYLGSNRTYRSGGATFSFGPGGGYYGNVPTYYYSAPYGYYGSGYGVPYYPTRSYRSHRRHR